MKAFDRIVTDPGIRSGKPRIRGTRITVNDIFEYLAAGDSVEDLLEGFPQLTREDIQACFAFAADYGQHVKVLSGEAVV